uniref:Uncharacterized protein n=1 Tax=Anguilla anguilla TaxID=7936 RepID=A0A0E9P6Q8_ANGAN
MTGSYPLPLCEVYPPGRGSSVPAGSDVAVVRCRLVEFSSALCARSSIGFLSQSECVFQ